MLRNIFLAIVVTIVCLGSQSSAQQPDGPEARIATIAPFLDDQTFFVARLDLARVDLDALKKLASQTAPANDPMAAQALAGFDAAAAVRQQLVIAGATQWYIVGSLARMQEKIPGFAVIALKPGADAQAVRDLVAGFAPMAQPFVKGNAVVLGTPGLQEWLGNFQAKPRPDFVRPFQAAGDTTLQIAFVPNEMLRALAGGAMAGLPLPPEAGGNALATLKDKMQWVVLTLRTPPQPALGLIVQLTDQAAAEQVRDGVAQALGMLNNVEELKKAEVNVDEIKKALTPQVRDNQVRIILTEANSANVTKPGFGDSLLKFLPKPMGQ